MIATTKVLEIERLLAEGTMSQRKIAQHCGVSRSTVSGIADGSRPDYDARRLARRQKQLEPLGPLVRCGECGGRVYAPCRLCRVRRLKAAEQAKRDVARRLPRHESWREGRPAADVRSVLDGRSGVEARRASVLLHAPDPRKAG